MQGFRDKVGMLLNIHFVCCGRWGLGGRLASVEGSCWGGALHVWQNTFGNLAGWVVGGIGRVGAGLASSKGMLDMVEVARPIVYFEDGCRLV